MNDQVYFTQEHTSRFYHDLRPLQDDYTVLTNPHKGWYFHYIDNGMKFQRYRDTIRPGDDLRSVPGINHMYLRFDWSDIEETEGVYDWSKLDEIIDTWGEKGYHFAMRLCTYEAHFPTISYATPKWLFDQGAGCYRHEYVCTGWHVDLAGGHGEAGATYFTMEPDYGDPLYLEKLEKLMIEFGRKYNGHPLIDFIDVGTFGTWGEGHTSAGSNRVFPLEVLKKHVDMHLRYFPDTFVLINDDMIRHNLENDGENARWLAEYCAAHRMGMRDDSIYVGGYCEKNGCSTLIIPTAFDLFWKNSPVDLENGHQLYLKHSPYMDGGFRGLEAMKRSHATYAGFHGDAYDWYSRHSGYHNYAANRLGYWYFPEGYELPPVDEGLNTRMVLYMSNRGFAPAYWRYDLRIVAKAEDGQEYLLNENGADNRSWQCGETARECLELQTSLLRKGQYQLCLGLFYGERPVLLGLKKENRLDNGYHILGEFKVL